VPLRRSAAVQSRFVRLGYSRVRIALKRRKSLMKSLFGSYRPWLSGALLCALAMSFPMLGNAADAASTPVTCKDGTTSPHGGRGACSGHGGIDKAATAAAAKGGAAAPAATAAPPPPPAATTPAPTMAKPQGVSLPGRPLLREDEAGAGHDGGEREGLGRAPGPQQALPVTRSRGRGIDSRPSSFRTPRTAPGRRSWRRSRTPRRRIFRGRTAGRSRSCRKPSAGRGTSPGPRDR
jgi:hypothetical protein